jgi:hypothetical protein
MFLELKLNEILFPFTAGLVSSFAIPVLFQSNSFRKQFTFGSN